MQIGRASWNNLGTNGSIDEVAIWNRSLSEDEIKDLYINGRVNWNYSEPVDLSTYVTFGFPNTSTSISVEYQLNEQDVFQSEEVEFTYNFTTTTTTTTTTSTTTTTTFEYKYQYDKYPIASTAYEGDEVVFCTMNQNGTILRNNNLMINSTGLYFYNSVEWMLIEAII